jgi:hypothetical protein
MAASDSDQASGDTGAHSARPANSDGKAAGNMCGDDIATTAAVVGVVAVGAVIFEAALIPGMILGVGAMLVPKVLPRLGEGLEPAFRATVRGAYKVGRKARHAFAEAKEQVHDVVAETEAESTAKHL